MKLFAILAASVSANCGGQITTEQRIYSPGWPGNYGADESCLWEIDLGDVYGFNLIPHHFDVEDFAICGFDYLMISANDDGGIYCGYNSIARKRRQIEEIAGVPKKTPAPRSGAASRFGVSTAGMPTYFVSGGVAQILFATDDEDFYSGFEIEIQIVEPPTTTAAFTTTTTSTTTTTTTTVAPIDCPNSAWEPNSANTACSPIDLTVQCDSTEITISAHVDHLYANLPSTLYGDVRLNMGECTGNSAPDANGWMTETFNLGTCGGDVTQSSQINVSWDGQGPPEVIMQDGVYVSSILGFKAECIYSSEISLIADPFSVDQIESTAAPVTNTSNFDDHFELNIFSDNFFSVEAAGVNIGETLFGSVTSNLNLGSLSYDYQITKCTAYDSANMDGLSYDILADHCSPSTAVAFDDADLEGGSGDDSADFSFTSFTFSTDDETLHIECDVKICVRGANGALLDSSCPTSCL